MSEKFDSLPAYKNAMIADFVFRPSRYEVWQDGELIDSGNVDSPLRANVRGKRGQFNKAAADILIDVGPASSIDHICSESSYDICITAGDRVQLITIPEEENENESVGLASSRLMLGSTRKAKTFNKDEPFCCNLFFIDGNIVKVSFSISHPEKLIEFYN